MIALTPKGKFPGRGKSNELVVFTNKIERIRIQVGNQSSLVISDQNAVLTIGRDLLRAVQSPSGMNYRGTYVASNTYIYGDVVRVTTTTSNKGLWVCVNTEGITGVSPVEGANWNNITLGPHQTDVCLDGETLQANVNRALATGE